MNKPPPTGEKRRPEDENTEEEQGEVVMLLVTGFGSRWSCDVPMQFPPKDLDVD